MGKVKFNIRREAFLAALLVGLVALIAFTRRENHSDVIQNVQVIIENDEDNHVLEEQDVFNLMQLERENLLGASATKLNLMQLEQRIRTNHWVKEANVYFDLKGNLFVEVNLRKAIARLAQPDGSGACIAADGTVMPVPRRFVLRTIIITGNKAQHLMRINNLYQDNYGIQLMALLVRLHEDAFWQAQIAQLDIAANGEINMIPQVGGQLIEFGQPVEVETKLKKLGIFFTRILPTRGWNRYHRVNVEYQNQIVAE
jgi:cell division protein FtsQ